MKELNEIVPRISDRAEELTEKTVTFLRDIIAIPSESGQEKEVVQRIKEEMESCGFDKVYVDPVGNIKGEIGTGPIHIWFDSHIDTVGIGDKSLWSIDPYKGEYDGKTVFGRGASDNKAAIATMTVAGQIVKELGLDKDVTLTVIGTVQEEDCDGLAMRLAIEESEVKPQFVVLGECTDLDIYRGHRGRMEIQVDIAGKSCHASAPERGVNAIYRSVDFIRKLEEQNKTLPNHDFLGRGSVALTLIESTSGSLNTVPDKCTMILDRRITWGETRESVLELVKEILPAEGATVSVLPYHTESYTGYKQNTDKFFPSWLLEEDHPLTRAGISAARQARGSEPGVSKWVFSTNGVASMGMLGIPTIGFGPSMEKFAHTVEDQVSVEHLTTSLKFYALFPQVLAGILSEQAD